MDEREPDPAIFSDKQVAQILRRAAELQSTSGKPQSPASGSSTQDLLQIGSEIGLDQRFVQQAIEELAAGAGESGSSWLGGSISTDVEQIFDGEVDDETWQGIVSDLRSAFGRIGSTNEIGTVREWSGGDKELDSIHFSVHSKDGKTRVRAISDLGGAFFLMTFLPGLFTLFGTIGALASGLPWELKVPIALLVVAAYFGLVRTMFGFTARRRQKAISRVMAKIASRVPQEGAVSALRQADSADELRLNQNA